MLKLCRMLQMQTALCKHQTVTVQLQSQSGCKDILILYITKLFRSTGEADPNRKAVCASVPGP